MNFELMLEDYEHFIKHIFKEENEPVSAPVSINLVNDRSVYLFNEHQWALYSWLHALENGTISEGANLLHVDAHHDIYCNPTYPQDKPKLENLIPSLSNGRIECGNFIVPALDWGLVSQMFWLKPGWGHCSLYGIELDKCFIELTEDLPHFRKNLPFENRFKHGSEVPSLDQPLILDLDLDYFANMGLDFNDPTYQSRYILDRKEIDRRVQKLFADLKYKEIKPDIVTIADSDQNNSFTPHFEVKYIRNRVLEQLADL